MQIKLRYFLLLLLILCFINIISVYPADAFSLNVNPASLLNRLTSKIITRVSDIIYYMVMQKKYVFDGFSDPNNYPPLNIPEQVENIPVVSKASTTVVKKTNENDLVTLSTATIPNKKEIVSPNTKINQGKISLPVQEMVIVKNQSASNQNQEKIESATKYYNNTDILQYTNLERGKESLGYLKSNAYLDKTASLRADDLFANQYFEHESPDGRSATELAEELGYSYILIGENLALGTFDSEQAIVTAWMGSPGHRANILNGKYTELGVAIKQGVYNGQNTTIAVQIFGLPLSNCPKPNQAAKGLIDETTVSIKEMQIQAAKMFENLNTIKNSPGLDKGYYNQKVSEYNYYAKKVNDAVLSLKVIIDSYNADVARYNSCIK